jgi:RNAse (barnase) inhibitor barstar
MTSFEKRLTEYRKSGVYRAVDLPPGLDAAAHAAGLYWRYIDLSSVKTKAQLLRLLARELAFPDWFGRNWDALEDSLTDLAWIDKDGLAIALGGFATYRRADPDGFSTLLDIFKSAAEYWRTEGRPFWVFLTGKPAATLELPILLV